MALPVSPPEVLKLAFATEQGRISRVTQTSDGAIFVLSRDQGRPPAVRPLSEVKDKAIAAWQAEKRRDVVAKEAEALAAAAKSGDPAFGACRCEGAQDDDLAPAAAAIGGYRRGAAGAGCKTVYGQARRRRHRRRWDRVLRRSVERDTGAADHAKTATAELSREIGAGLQSPISARSSLGHCAPVSRSRSEPRRSTVCSDRSRLDRAGPADKWPEPMLGKAKVRFGRAKATNASASAEPYLRPAELVYAVDEIPPPLRLVLIGLQYAIMTAIYLIIVAIILRHVRPPRATVLVIMGIACIALAVGTALQALPRGPIGSGFLAPPVFSATYLGPSVMAAEIGGMRLVLGMTLFAGIVEVLVGLSLNRLRLVVTPILSGLTVFVVGLQLGVVGIGEFLDVRHEALPAFPLHFMVTVLTLSSCIALSIWGRGTLKAVVLTDRSAHRDERRLAGRARHAGATSGGRATWFGSQFRI